MTPDRIARAALLGAALALLSACGGSGGLFGSAPAVDPATLSEQELAALSAAEAQQAASDAATGGERQSSFFDLFTNSDDPNTTVEVNKYLWVAALDVLNFLPVEKVDPFTGVIVFGYGTPPGGGRSYRATVFIQDPALDARSLKIAMQTKGGGAVDPEVIRAVEDAILTRARQLRIADSNL